MPAGRSLRQRKAVTYNEDLLAVMQDENVENVPKNVRKASDQTNVKSSSLFAMFAKNTTVAAAAKKPPKRDTAVKKDTVKKSTPPSRKRSRATSEDSAEEEEEGSENEEAEVSSCSDSNEENSAEPSSEETACKVCGENDDPESILLCDGCPDEYHMRCLKKPLSKMPEGDWYCPNCDKSRSKKSTEKGSAKSNPMRKQASKDGKKQWKALLGNMHKMPKAKPAEKKKPMPKKKLCKTASKPLATKQKSGKRKKSENKSKFLDISDHSSDDEFLESMRMDTVCQVCKSNENADTILLCDGCPDEYHMTCLEEPLEELPDGDWFCPKCEEKNNRPKMDAIIAFRPKAKKKQKKGRKNRMNAAVEAEEEQLEFLVKWLDKSYVHCTWQTAEQVQECYNGKAMLTRFLKKKDDGNLPEEDFESGIYFETRYTIVDRIIDEMDPDCCFQCGVDNCHDSMIMCDGCPSQYHIYCLTPPLDAVPSEDWFCPVCVAKKTADETEASETADDTNAATKTPTAEMDTSAEPGDAKTEPQPENANTADPKVVVNSAQEEQKPDMKYMVKWCSLGYDQCTWETRQTISRLTNSQGQNASIEIERYYLFNQRYLEKSKNKHGKVGTVTDKPAAQQSLKKKIESMEFPGERSLRSYQLDGVSWLCFNWHANRNSILADEMGLGKTVQSVSLCKYLNDVQQVSGPFLVVVPLSTIPHWQREFDGWSTLNCVSYYGNEDSRELIQQAEWYNVGYPESKRVKGVYRFDVVVTTYETLLVDSAFLSPIKWKLLIVDEAQRLKNFNSRFSRTLREEFSYEHSVLLTGTPIQNNTTELWSLLSFLQPKRFADQDEFHGKFGDLKSKDQVDQLHKILKPCLLRRMKDDVEKKLPPRQETLIEVDLTATQKRYYKAVYERNTEYLMQSTGGAKNMPSLMNIAMQLRKCCMHPYMLKGVEDAAYTELQESQFALDPQGKSRADKIKVSNASVMKHLVDCSAKFALLDKLLPKLKAQGHRVLIFSQFVRLLDILEDYLEYRSFSFERIDGSITGVDRQNAIDRYSAPDSNRFVFLLCTKAGGVGINLTAADTCIIFDSDWNPQNDLQAQARCHRIGQTKSVKVYRLITRNTYEMQMFHRSSLKMGLDKAVLHSMTSSVSSNSSGDNYRANLSMKEIENLLKKGAYHAFMAEDYKTAEISEQDIDEILSKNSTLLQFESETTGDGSSSSFAKASFVSDTTGNDINIDDPEFWSKVGLKKAKTEDLKTRKRKNVDYSEKSLFALTNAMGDEDFSGLDLSDSDADDDSKNLKRERDAFVSALVRFGYGRWSEIRAEMCHQLKPAAIAVTPAPTTEDTAPAADVDQTHTTVEAQRNKGDSEIAEEDAACKPERTQSSTPEVDAAVPAELPLDYDFSVSYPDKVMVRMAVSYVALCVQLCGLLEPPQSSSISSKPSKSTEEADSNSKDTAAAATENGVAETKNPKPSKPKAGLAILQNGTGSSIIAYPLFLQDARVVAAEVAAEDFSDSEDEVEADKSPKTFPDLSSKNFVELMEADLLPAEVFDEKFQKSCKSRGKTVLSLLDRMCVVCSAVESISETEARLVVDPTPSIHRSVAKPAPWWGAQEDRDFLLGLYLNGSTKMADLATDSRLSFSKTIGSVRHVTMEKKVSKKKKSSEAESSTAPASDEKETQQDQAGAKDQVAAQEPDTVEVLCQWPSEGALKNRLRAVATAVRKEIIKATKKEVISKEKAEKLEQKALKDQMKKEREEEKAKKAAELAKIKEEKALKMKEMLLKQKAPPTMQELRSSGTAFRALCSELQKVCSSFGVLEKTAVAAAKKKAASFWGSKTPTPFDAPIAALKKQLEDAIFTQAFEKCAPIRDEIKKLEQQRTAAIATKEAEDKVDKASSIATSSPKESPEVVAVSSARAQISSIAQKIEWEAGPLLNKVRKLKRVYTSKVAAAEKKFSEAVTVDAPDSSVQPASQTSEVPATPVSTEPAATPESAASVLTAEESSNLVELTEMVASLSKLKESSRKLVKKTIGESSSAPSKSCSGAKAVGLKAKGSAALPAADSASNDKDAKEKKQKQSSIDKEKSKKSKAKSKKKDKSKHKKQKTSSGSVSSSSFDLPASTSPSPVPFSPSQPITDPLKTPSNLDTVSTPQPSGPGKSTTQSATSIAQQHVLPAPATPAPQKSEAGALDKSEEQKKRKIFDATPTAPVELKNKKKHKQAKLSFFSPPPKSVETEGA
mmetsp:Transcript_23013/g.45496  ORF Transcript_23013/g.45496 Transcript_23013/m.45496 type:complete len:2218 (-) Transcript_23013:218-6871(-)